MAYTITSLGLASTAVGTAASDVLAAATLANQTSLTANSFEGNDTITLGVGNYTTVDAGMGAGIDTFNTAAGTVAGGNIRLGDAADTFTGGAGAIATSSVKGGGGADGITFNSNLTSVFTNGNAGVDTIAVAGGRTLTNTTLVGGSEGDIFNLNLGGQTSSRVNGQKGNDVINIAAAGANVSTTIFGGSENDIITNASAQALRLSGDNGNDQITDGAGASQLFGGAGADILTGAAGQDTTTGGDGVDTFVYGAGSAFAGTGAAAGSLGAAGASIAANDTIVFGTAGVAVETITDFSAEDRINSQNGTAAISGIGLIAADTAAALRQTSGTAGTQDYFFSGTYDTTTGTFTITADGGGADTLLALNDGAGFAAATQYVLLQGTNSATVAAGTFF